jgi:hypothetical protein
MLFRCVTGVSMNTVPDAVDSSRKVIKKWAKFHLE